MEPLLFADHLRRMHETQDGVAPLGRPAFEFAGTGRLVGAACAACLFLVMLQAARSAPVPPADPQIAAISKEEAVH